MLQRVLPPTLAITASWMLQHNIGQALAGAHHIGGKHGLISADQHKGLTILTPSYIVLVQFPSAFFI